MKILIIDRVAEGPPLLLVPDGLLLRWPSNEGLPQVGEDYKGKTIRLSKPEHRALLLDLLHGNPIERCEAARRLPSSVVLAVYSKSQMNNLRRIAREMTPGLRLHVLAVLGDGLPVSLRLLLEAVSGRTEAEQFKRWNEATAR